MTSPNNIIIWVGRKINKAKAIMQLSFTDRLQDIVQGKTHFRDVKQICKEFQYVQLGRKWN